MIDIKKLNKYGKLKEEENFLFRQFLKENADSEKLDKQFKELHEKYFKIMDCSKCLNCCKKLGSTFTKEEFDKICEKFNLDKEKFIKKYFKEENKYILKPCLFLKDKKCMLDKNKPLACKEYPFTNKKDRLFSLYSIIDNSKICPVVYEILEELKDIYNFKRKKIKK